MPLATIYEIRFVSMVPPHPHLADAGRFHEVIPYEMKMGNLPMDSVHTLPVIRHKR